ncbi:MAG: hypothetical protein ACYS5V_07925 [Planctomycetota bacterium]|jgi:hypothetical protein
MKKLIYICLGLVLMGCAEQEEPEYLSATAIVEQGHRPERFKDSDRRWALHEVLGPDGPCRRGRAMPVQSNPGQPITFHVNNEGARISKRYVPETKQDFFLAIPVVNRKGQNAAIILGTTGEHDIDLQTKP